MIFNSKKVKTQDKIMQFMNASRTVRRRLLTAPLVEKVADVRLESFFSLANPPRNLRTMDGRSGGGLRRPLPHL